MKIRIIKNVAHNEQKMGYNVNNNEPQPISDNVDIDPEYELNFCPNCLQMTNHLNNICQKHKRKIDD